MYAASRSRFRAGPYIWKIYREIRDRKAPPAIRAGNHTGRSPSGGKRPQFSRASPPPPADPATWGGSPSQKRATKCPPPPPTSSRCSVSSGHVGSLRSTTARVAARVPSPMVKRRPSGPSWPVAPPAAPMQDDVGLHTGPTGLVGLMLIQFPPPPVGSITGDGPCAQFVSRIRCANVATTPAIRPGRNVSSSSSPRPGDQRVSITPTARRWPGVRRRGGGVSDPAASHVHRPDRKAPAYHKRSTASLSTMSPPPSSAPPAAVLTCPGQARLQPSSRPPARSLTLLKPQLCSYHRDATGLSADAFQ